MRRRRQPYGEGPDGLDPHRCAGRARPAPAPGRGRRPAAPGWPPPAWACGGGRGACGTGEKLSKVGQERAPRPRVRRAPTLRPALIRPPTAPREASVPVRGRRGRHRCGGSFEGWGSRVRGPALEGQPTVPAPAGPAVRAAVGAAIASARIGVLPFRAGRACGGCAGASTAPQGSPRRGGREGRRGVVPDVSRAWGRARGRRWAARGIAPPHRPRAPRRALAAPAPAPCRPRSAARCRWRW